MLEFIMSYIQVKNTCKGNGKLRQLLCGEFSRGHVYMPVCMSRGCVGNLMIDLLFIPCFCYQKRP